MSSADRSKARLVIRASTLIRILALSTSLAHYSGYAQPPHAGHAAPQAMPDRHASEIADFEGIAHPLDVGGMASIRARHLGAPVIVHLWGLTCAPCLAEMPKWGRLAREVPKGALLFIETEQISPSRLHSIVSAAGLLRAEHWVFSPVANEDRLRFEIDPEWQGELPRTLFITADGAIHGVSGDTDFKTVRRWLR